MEIAIHTATINDVTTLVENNLAMALETEDLELDRKTVTAGVLRLIEKKDNGFYLIASYAGINIASLMITTEWSDWRDGIFWWVQSVFVRPEYRRMGIYTKLYNEVKTMAIADKDVRGFRLYVEKNNDTAIQTYLANGMNETHYRLYEELV